MTPAAANAGNGATPRPEVVITGRGVVAPIGEGVGEFAEALFAGRSGIEDAAGSCADFDPQPWTTRKQARRTDRFTQMAVSAAGQALAEAGLAPDDRIAEEDRNGGPSEQLEGADPARVGVVIGSGIGGFETLQRETFAYKDGGARAVSPHFVPMLMPNAAAAAIAMRTGAHGPGFCVSSACATGNHALGEAKRMIERGEADVVIAGGSEAPLVEVAIAAFKQMGALSKQGVSRPFDKRRDGFVMGEGAGVLVLESAEHAAGRGAKVVGRLAGYGASNDAFHITQPDPEGAGAQRAIRAALADAGADPGDVGYVNAHGTSTPFNDRIESKAIRSVFGDEAPPASSTKSQIGHLLGAAGAVEAVATLLALETGSLPATINYGEEDPDCELDCIPDGPREAPGLELALSNSFGFGGQNACLVLAKG
ncbi:beta-ketoacyl-[acyl-carrier-protein] synthase family protein [Thermoleophilia bacterium SCSIO 60948]|nr:beta-ketoacyl-[acyl-carrier-protein] synthase family protein [Thermoleophilia bacterium SCSIO 60948]